MAFSTRTNTQASSENKVKVDWAALDKYVVETSGLQSEEVLTGVISGIYDLGIQEQEDAKLEWNGTEEQEREEIAKNGNTYFENLYDYESKKEKRYKRYPQKPVQSVAFAVDFPDILIDKSPFFGGESNPKPLRLLLGGEFVLKGGTKIVAKPFPLVARKNEKTNNKWSFPFNSTIYKMAAAAKLVEQGEPFVPQEIDKLLGVALQFKARVWFKDGYYNEKCAFSAGLGRGMKAPEFDDSILQIIQFDADNAEDQLKQLRISVRNTMARASDYAGSKLEGQLNKLFPNSRANTSQNAAGSSTSASTDEAKPTHGSGKKPAQNVPVSANEPPIDIEDDIPFNRFMSGKLAYAV
jgi:hypothetical protein